MRRRRPRRFYDKPSDHPSGRSGLVNSPKGGDDGAPDFFIHTKIAEYQVLKRKQEDGSEVSVGMIQGYASTKDLDLVNDIVLPRAFEESLPQYLDFPHLFWMHSPAAPLGKVAAAVIDENGLFVTAEINLETQLGKETWSLIQQGAVRSFSIGYKIPEGGVEFDDRMEAFIVTKIELKEISVVTMPANLSASFEIAEQMKAWAGLQTKYRLGPSEERRKALREGEAQEAEVLLQLAAMGACASAASSTRTQEMARLLVSPLRGE